jgi:NADH-quinone oxidoreductase subunit N
VPADTSISIWSLLPELILLIAGCAALLVGQARREATARWTQWLTLVAIVSAAIVVFVWRIAEQGASADAGPIPAGLALTSLAAFVRSSALVLGVVITLVAWSEPSSGERGEFFAMMLFSLTGLMLVGPADDLVTLFLALELVSIPTYVMVVLSRSHARALEAGTKYFYLGAMSAAIMAYGFSFLYGVSGTTSLPETVAAVTAALSAPGTTEYALATIGLVLALGGLLFKIAAVPLHFYIADVYQGAASSVAGLLGFVPKLAGMVAILKVISLTGHWRSLEGGVFWLLWIVAAVTMTVGNVLALRQTNVKRMLGYSGIAHSGYMLVGILAGPHGGGGLMGDGIAAVLYYVVIYGIANLGAFAVLGLLRLRGEACETLRDIAGLLRRQPTMALLMSLAMLTLMGLPPTAGFWGKLSLFGSALTVSQNVSNGYQSWLVALVIIGVLNSAMAVAYYLRVTAACLLYESDEPVEVAPREAQRTGAVACGFLLLIFMFYPNALLNSGRYATDEFRDQFARRPAVPRQLHLAHGRQADSAEAELTRAPPIHVPKNAATP